MCRFVRNKEIVLKLLIGIFRRAVVFLYQNDDEFKSMLLKSGVRCFSISILKTGLYVNVILDGKGISVESFYKKCELDMIFKEPCTAFKAFSGLISLEEAFAQKGIILKGSIAKALAITRAVKRLQTLIFPDIWIKRVFKEFEKSGAKERLTFYKFYLYCIVNLGR